MHSALQRAHKTVGERVDSQSQQATLVALGDAPLRRLVDRYVRAWESCDVDSILAMLTEDAVLAMPPRATWYRGGEAIGAFLADWPLAGGRWRLVSVRASGQIAFGSYRWDGRAGAFAPHAVDVLTLRGERISAITAFMIPHAFGRFGLAPEPT